MATPLLTNHVAGPFTATYKAPSASALTIGYIGGGGIKEIIRYEGEDYAVDLLGESVVEGVYLGGQCFIEFQLEEVNYANVQKLAHPFAATVGNEGELGVPGTFLSAKAGELVLTPTLNTPAYSQTTPVRTYGLVTLAAGFELEKIFSVRRRKYAIRMRAYPYLTAGVLTWFTKAANS